MAVSKAVHSNRPALRVTWIPPQSDVVITLCQVQYRRVGTSWGAVSRVTSGSITSTVLQALSVGTAYQVRIRAVSVIGNGSWSSVESVTTFMSKLFNELVRGSGSYFQCSIDVAAVEHPYSNQVTIHMLQN